MQKYLHLRYWVATLGDKWSVMMTRNKARNTLIHSLLFVVCAVFFLNGISCAYEIPVEPIPVEVQLKTIQSKILNETRRFRVALPDGYSTEENYPVIYSFDARSDNFHTPFTACDWPGKPKFIIVGIENTDRSRDMFPVRVGRESGRHRTSGGGRNFLSFITKELIPYIDSNYATNDFRILIGYSNSGVFTLYAMTEEPDYFDAYIAGSPMVGYCQEFLTKQVKAFFNSDTSSKKVLYMNQGVSDYDRVLESMPSFTKVLKETAPAGFRWTHEIIKGGGHVPPSTQCDGLKFIFEKEKN